MNRVLLTSYSARRGSLMRFLYRYLNSTNVACVVFFLIIIMGIFAKW